VRKSRSAIWIGLVISAILLWVVLEKVDLGEIRDSFALLDPSLLLMGGFAVATGMFLRSIRWRLIAGCSHMQHSRFAGATYFGVLANLVFPARAGEVIRIMRIADVKLLPLPRAVASAMIDRFIDLVVLAASAVFVYLRVPGAGVLGEWLSILAVAVFVLAAFTLLVVRRAELWKEWGISFLRKSLRKWALRPEVFLSDFLADLNRLVRGFSSLKILAVGIAVWCMDYAAVAFVLMSIGLALPFEAPLMLWVFLAAGSALPSAPGYVGVYQVAAILALSFYDVPSSSAVAVALALQLVTVMVATLMSARGLIGLVVRRRGLGVANVIADPVVTVQEVNRQSSTQTTKGS
jgi:uncharacterized protein (TIRG00374 family)